jgi:CBS domain-containing protein
VGEDGLIARSPKSPDMSSDGGEEGSSPGDSEREILRKLDLKVKEIMSPDPLTIQADATVVEAAKAMEKQDSSYALVQADGEIVGMITERDIARRVVAKEASPEKTRVKSVMTSRIVVTSPDAGIEEALKVMTANKVRRLPVVDQKAGLVELLVQQILKAPISEDSYQRQLGAILGFGTHDRLPQIKAPTLILHGRKDILVPPKNGSILAEAIPNARLVYLENSAHGLVEDMDEAINSVTGFLG